MTRRRFAKLSAGTILSAASPSFLSAQEKYYGGFKMGLHSFVLRNHTFDQAIEIASGLGFQYLETFEGHLPQNASNERIEELKCMMEKRDIRLMSYGVVGFDRGAEDRTIATFELARKFEMFSISANPSPDTFDLIEKLVEKYGINIAIHPHGPEYDRYPGWRTVEKTIAGRHERIGICMDVGHISRNSENAIEGIYRLGKRVYGVHLKDVDRLGPSGKDTIISQGIIDFPALFEALKKIGYQGMISLECEMNPDNPLPDITQSLVYLRKILN